MHVQPYLKLLYWRALNTANIRPSYDDKDVGFSIFNGRNGTVNLQFVIKAGRGEKGNKQRSIGKYRFDNSNQQITWASYGLQELLEAGGETPIEQAFSFCINEGQMADESASGFMSHLLI